jgi:hypothetical protein
MLAENPACTAPVAGSSATRPFREEPLTVLNGPAAKMRVPSGETASAST